MLETLTDEQAAILDRIGKDWRKSILAPGRVDIERMKPYLAKAYAAIGKKLPKIIVRDTSPTVCLSVIFGDAAPPLGHDYIRRIRKRESRLYNKSLKNSLQSQFHAEPAQRAITSQSFMKLIVSLENNFVDAYAATRLNVLRHIGTTLSEKQEDELACSLLHLHQQFLTADLSYFQFLDELGFLSTASREPLACLSEIVRGSYCCWLGDEFCLFCDKPAVKLDDRDRLHCEDGPAVEFERSEVYFWHTSKYYAWHGVFVPEKIVLDPLGQKIEDITSEPNQEIRRIRIERLGWLAYLRMTEAKVLDTRRNEIEGTQEVLMHSLESRVLVCACPSTARVYALEVPWDIKSCEQAQGWLSGGLSKRIMAAT